MKNNQCLIALAIAVCSSSVIAEEKIDYSFSAKMWNTQIRNNGEAASQSAYGPILSATAKKGDYFVTASFLMPTTYTTSATYTTRRDADLALGWSVNSNVALLLGQKTIGANKYDSGSWNIETVHISYLGANGFTSIGENQFLYGTLTRSFKAKDSNGGTPQSITFTNYEAGYGYVLNKNTQLSAGYRMQKFDVSGGGAKIPGLIVGATFTP